MVTAQIWCIIKQYSHFSNIGHTDTFQICSGRYWKTEFESFKKKIAMISDFDHLGIILKLWFF